MIEQQPNIRDLFEAARQITVPAERAAYLNQACGTDAALRARLDALLRVNDEDSNFLNLPVTEFELPVPGVQYQPGTVIGPYTVVSLLGEGGMGAVYLAEQAQPVRRKVALKIIKVGLDSRSVMARFEAERQALALMDHPNIAKVLDAGAIPAQKIESGRPYFVMELIPGIPLTRYCDQHNLSVDQRLALFVQTCQAVQHAHQKGIIHRDLKPSNVLVAVYDGVAVVKVIDFGVAKAIGSRLTEDTFDTAFGSIIGTLEYMSPEQAEPDQTDVDTRSDIYSLGVLLYELLTGTTPFQRRKLREAAWLEMLRMIREDEPTKPSTRISTIAELPSVAAQRGLEPKRLSGIIRGDLDWIVMKTLEKDRDRRYATANGLARDIQNYLSGQPVEAGPPSVAYRVQKFVGRHRAAVVTATAFVALLISAVVVSAWQAQRAKQAERIALAEQVRADQEAAAAKAVSDFLQNDLLAQADIGKQAGGAERNRNITVRELLDRAADTVEARFQGQEQVEATIRRTLGRAYSAVGAHPLAKAQLERALAIRTEKLGPMHADTLESKQNLGLLAHQAGRLDEADKILREVLAERSLTLGAEHRDTLRTSSNLGWLCFDRGKYGEAEELTQKALAGLKKLAGDNDSDTLIAKHNLAMMFGRNQRTAEAEQLFREVIDSLKAKHGGDHPHVLGALNNLGMLLWMAGRMDESGVVLQQVYDLRRSRLPPNHPQTLESMQNLATNLLERGQRESGERMLKEVVEIQRRTLTADHPDTLLSINNLGEHFRNTDRLTEAEPLFREAAERAVKVHGATHPHTRRMAANLAGVHQELGTPQNAEALLRELIAAQRTPAEQFNLAHAELQALLAENLIEQKKFAEAEPLARSSLAIRLKLAPERWPAQYAKYLVGSSLFGQGKHAEAEPKMVEAIQGMQGLVAKLPAAKPLLARAIGRLVQLYESTGRPDDAKKWRELAIPPAKPQ